MGVRIRHQLLPGMGHRYELLLEHHRRLVVVELNDGRREIRLGSGDDDEDDGPGAVLSHDQAVAVAALLTGAKFSIDTTQDDAVDADEVGIDTVVIGPRSPAVGRLVSEVPLPSGADAAVLGLIRDRTPELMEDESSEPCQPGDRIVVAARRDRLAELIERLRG